MAFCSIQRRYGPKIFQYPFYHISDITNEKIFYAAVASVASLAGLAALCSDFARLSSLLSSASTCC